MRLLLWRNIINDIHPEGRYKMVLKDQRPGYTITLLDSIYYKRYKGKQVSGQIFGKRYNDGSVKIYLYDDEQPTFKTSVDSLLADSFGSTVVELNYSRTDTIPFRTTYAFNLHIQLNEGMLIRIKR
ncbi:hypothetical protein [Hufsiella ginkgonis]|uniref:Uncharacterized protein n=1 Tax=Hufsiella ginkgonis TaxID=2695274 RepID=A0A7K1Y0N0_9SPHI|nr:hypothetical protein [Hufsiella ginkgonis]MXV16579.1 hypothetical protein [Hufsiella ginkgonis]